MKNLLLIILTASCVYSNEASAQNCDNIILQDGTEISAIVKEIRVSEVTYKKCNFIDGPLYTISKSDIFLIKYKNGEKELMQSIESASESTITEDNNIPEPSKKYNVIDSIPIDEKCLTFYLRKRTFTAKLVEFKVNAFLHKRCDQYNMNYYHSMKSSINKIEDEFGNVIYQRKLD